MTGKSFLRKLVWFVFFVTAILLYLGLYVFPTLKDMNRIKRDIHKMKVRISDIGKMQNRFVHSDLREEIIFQKKEEELKRRFPMAGDHQDFVRLADHFSEYIRKTGAADGIQNLILMSLSDAIMIKKNLLVSNEELFNELEVLAIPRYKEMVRQQESVGIGEAKAVDASLSNMLPVFVDRLKSLSFYLGFFGESKQAASFINHIPWYRHYIDIETALVFEINGRSLYWVKVKLYFLDGKILSSVDKQLRRKEHWEPANFMVDFHSDVLLRRIYNFLPDPFKRKEIL